MKDMILFPEDIEQLDQALSQLVLKANLLLAVLINKDGRLLTSQGTLEVVDTVSMAALVAGNSASTLAIANLMGETEFSTMYHQGKDKHIYIAIVDDNTFLALVFDDRTNIDRVKVFARQFDRQLKQCLEQVYNKTEDQVSLDLDMGLNGGYDSAQQYIPNQYTENQNYYPPNAAMPAQQVQDPYYAAPPQTFSQPLPEVPPPGNAGNTSGEKLRSQEDSDVFYIEPSKGMQGKGQNDTNYLYLKNKIRETNVKRKMEE